MKKFMLFTLFAVLLASCLPQNVQVPQSPLLSVLERKSGLIVYLGIDGNMYVSDQGGGNLVQVTKDAHIPQSQTDPYLIYQFPTWAHDGSHLAFVGLKGQGTQNPNASKVVIANMDDESANEVYNSDNEQPVYLYWSPDNINLSFISSNFSGQNLILQNVSSESTGRTILDTGSPYYWSWAPDGHVMIVHAGGAANSSPEHLAFLSVDGKENVIEDGLDETLAAFQSPAWSPDGSHIALTRQSNGEKQVIMTDAAGQNPKKVGTFTSKTAFAWAPDGTRLAYLDGTQALDAGTFGPLRIYDLETSKESSVDDDIVAFFWSPSGEEIAYFKIVQINPTGSSGSTNSNAQTQTGLQLHVLDVGSGKSRELFTYRPTQQFINILPYFDQYHQSVTIWSPDNNNLVLSFVDDQGNPGIAIVAASGNLEPRILTQGYLAFWSWK